MLKRIDVEELAATYAKEIVVANLSNTNLIIDADSGKKVAEFYNEIFKGIAETLKSVTVDSNIG